MRHFLTLLLLAGSLQCFGQIARDSEPAAPLVAQVAAAQSPYVRPDSARQQSAVYICDSKTAKAYHNDEGCRGLARCTHEVVKVTKREAEGDYGQVPCYVCY